MNTKIKLTKKQQEILDFINKHQDSTGAEPRLLDIANHFGFSVVNASNHKRALKKLGLIKVSLTKKQDAVLILIKAGIKAHGKSPTYSEIGGVLGLSEAVVCARVDAMKKKGILEKKGNFITVVDNSKSDREIELEKENELLRAEIRTLKGL